MLAVKYFSKNCYTIGIEDTINSIKEVEILVSLLLSYMPILTPPKFIIGNLLRRISCNSKGKETVHFANKVLIVNIRFSNTIKRYYIILKTNGNIWSTYSIN